MLKKKGVNSKERVPLKIRQPKVEEYVMDGYG
jgi:hypothetical protein